MRHCAVGAWIFLLVAGCGGGGGSPGTDSGPAGADSGPGPDAGSPGARVSFAGTARDFTNSPVSGATVTVLEDATVTTTTGAGGAFTLSLLAETPVTLRFARAGYATTIEQTFVLHGAASGFVGWMAQDAQFDIVQSEGGGAPGTSVILLVANPASPSVTCTLAAGTTFATVPSAGRVVYGDSTNYPDGSLTSEGVGGTWAYVANAVPGTYAPAIMPTGCTTMDPFPFEMGAVTALGELTITERALYSFSLWVH